MVKNEERVVKERKEKKQLSDLSRGLEVVPQESRESATDLIRIQKTLALDYSFNINGFVCEIKILNFSQDLIQFIDFGFMRLESKIIHYQAPLVHDTGVGSSHQINLTLLHTPPPSSHLISMVVLLSPLSIFGSVTFSKIKEAKGQSRDYHHLLIQSPKYFLLYHAATLWDRSWE